MVKSDSADSVAIQSGLKSHGAKRGIVSIIFGILVGNILVYTVFNRPDDELSLWPHWLVWLLYGLLVISVLSVFLGCINTLREIYIWKLKGSCRDYSHCCE